MNKNQIDWDQFPLDKNNQEQKQRRKELFKQFFVTKDGLLSSYNFIKGINKVLKLDNSLDCKPAIIRAFKFAKNHRKETKQEGDYIEFKEFRLFLIAIKQYFEYLEVFEINDNFEDKRISLREFKQALPVIEKWTCKIEDVEQQFNEIDTNDGGQILFDEFCDWAIDKSLALDDSKENDGDDKKMLEDSKSEQISTQQEQKQDEQDQKQDEYYIDEEKLKEEQSKEENDDYYDKAFLKDVKNPPLTILKKGVLPIIKKEKDLQKNEEEEEEEEQQMNEEEEEQMNEEEEQQMNEEEEEQMNEEEEQQMSEQEEKQTQEGDETTINAFADAAQVKPTKLVKTEQIKNNSNKEQSDNSNIQSDQNESEQQEKNDEKELKEQKQEKKDVKAKIQETIQMYETMLSESQSKEETQVLKQTLSVLKKQITKLSRMSSAKEKQQPPPRKRKQYKKMTKQQMIHRNLKKIFTLYCNKYLMKKKNYTFDEQKQQLSCLKFPYFIQFCRDFKIAQCTKDLRGKMPMSYKQKNYQKYKIQKYNKGQFYMFDPKDDRERMKQIAYQLQEKQNIPIEKRGIPSQQLTYVFKKYSNGNRGIEVNFKNFIALLKELSQIFYHDQTDIYETDQEKIKAFYNYIWKNSPENFINTVSMQPPHKKPIGPPSYKIQRNEFKYVKTHEKIKKGVLRNLKKSQKNIVVANAFFIFQTKQEVYETLKATVKTKNSALLKNEKKQVSQNQGYCKL